MVVGKLLLVLTVPGARSLKTKRRAVRSIKDRVRGRYNVSIAEVDAQDYWQTAMLAVCAVGTDRAYVEGLLDQVLNLIRQRRDVVLGRSEKEFI